MRDAPDVEIDVTRTHHGPVLFGDPRTGSAITMRWTAVDRPNTTLRSILPMLRARSVDELEDCMRWWVDPCNNFVMADTRGTIAYLHRGRVPVRPRANGWAPVPGWTGDHEWSDDVPFEDLPRLRDPDAGFIATANNRVQAGNDPYLGMDYGPSYRARRVVERLKALDNATPQDMASVHADRVTLASSVFMDAVTGIVPWNGTMDPDSVGATVYAVLREKVAEILCEREPVRDVVTNGFTEEPLPIPTQSRIRAALPRLIEQDDRTILDGAGWGDLLAEAAERAVAWLEDTLGGDRAGWQWSRVHTTGAAHPMSKDYPELNPVRVATGGDGETVQATGWQIPVRRATHVGRSLRLRPGRLGPQWLGRPARLFRPPGQSPLRRPGADVGGRGAPPDDLLVARRRSGGRDASDARAFEVGAHALEPYLPASVRDVRREPERVVDPEHRRV